MDLFIQLTATGIARGALLGLIAVGFAIIYGTSRHFHIAHIAAVTGAGYIGVVLARNGVPLGLGFVLTIMIVAIAGALTFRIVYAPLEARGGTGIVVFIASLGLLTFVENGLLAKFGATAERVSVTGWLSETVVVGPVTMSNLELVLVAFSVCAFSGVVVALHRPGIGVLLRAVSSSPELFKVMGRRPSSTLMVAYAAGSALAAAAGYFLALDAGMVPLRGHEFFIPAAMAVLLGGLGSVTGAYLFALVFGVLQTVLLLWVPSGWTVAIIFGLFLVVIVMKPSGLFAATGARAGGRTA